MLATNQERYGKKILEFRLQEDMGSAIHEAEEGAGRNRTLGHRSFQFSSVAQSCPTLCDPWTTAHQASLSFIISWSLLELLSVESVIRSNCLNLCHPLLLPPSVFPSIRVFSYESVLHIRWPKYWSFSFSISLPLNIQD